MNFDSIFSGFPGGIFVIGVELCASIKQLEELLEAYRDGIIVEKDI